VSYLKSYDPSNNRKYFDPRFIKIQRGEIVAWINDDTKDHTLLSHKFEQATGLLRIGPIAPGKEQSVKIDYEVSKIDYFCLIHPEEMGTIVILEKKEDELTNTKNLRMVSNVLILSRHLLWIIWTRQSEKQGRRH
jgi:plastocyanin